MAVLAPLLERVMATRTPLPAGLPGRRSAVLVALYDGPRGPALLLTKRTADLLHHPGQISLPGGKFEHDDRTLDVTALRETQEELGIDRGRVRVLGQLDEVSTIASDFIITPFVGVVAGHPAPVAEPREIARVMVVDVAEVLRHDATMTDDVPRLQLRYPLDGEDVWGATARILRLFARVTREALAAG